MSRRAKMVLDKEFQIAPIDKRIYGFNYIIFKIALTPPYLRQVHPNIQRIRHDCPNRVSLNFLLFYKMRTPSEET